MFVGEKNLFQSIKKSKKQKSKIKNQKIKKKKKYEMCDSFENKKLSLVFYMNH